MDPKTPKSHDQATEYMPEMKPGVHPSKPSQGEKKFGQRTVGLMIQKALKSARLSRQSGTSKSTKYFEALVERKVKSTSLRLRRIVAALVALLVLSGAGLGYYLYRNRSVQVFQTTQINYGDAAGGTIASANRYTVFLLAGRLSIKGTGVGDVQGFCSAFAISQDVLATNAHCVETASKKFKDVIAIMNGAPSNRYAVTKMVAHPGYVDGTISPDVGLVRISGRLARAAAIAPQTELAQVVPGSPVYLYGFPGRLNKEDAPEATFIKGDIGRVTTFDQRLGDFGSNTLLQHSAFSASGTSGSPMFNSAGRVIGINAGGYVESGQKLAGYNFGMRVDLIYPLFPLLAD